ncbi:MAG: ankyrin repeat domain-containing protein [Acidobacteria bacterium]|nr:ankyrin repeat domain-containing protein [Acidobacteriota bacterium]
MLLLDRIANGRTDLVFEYLSAGHPITATDSDGVSLLQWAVYYGDVSAIRHLLAHGARLEDLGDNFDLNGAVFHGHWRLCEFLIEQGADPNVTLPDTRESPLHAALCTTERVRHNRVMEVLLAHGADPNVATLAGAETGGFMRDCRTRGETPLHRAAAFGDEEAIRMLVAAGARLDARDANGDSPLGWASWHLRPASILRLLCFGEFRVRAGYSGMDANLCGWPKRS